MCMRAESGREEKKDMRDRQKRYITPLNLIMTDIIYHMERMNNKFKSDRDTDDSSDNNGFGTFPACHCANSPNYITERECNKCLMISFESDTSFSTPEERSRLAVIVFILFL